MLQIGKKYRQIGGDVKQLGRKELIWVRPGFSFGCEVGTYKGKVPSGFDHFDLGRGSSCIRNGGNYEEEEINESQNICSVCQARYKKL